MFKKTFIILALLVFPMLCFATLDKESTDCPLWGTPACPIVQAQAEQAKVDCPLAGTPACPLVQEKSEQIAVKTELPKQSKKECPLKGTSACPLK